MANITNLKTRLVVSIFLVVLGVQAAAGRTIYVTTTGNNVRGKGSSGSPYCTIQKGIDSAVDGDTVLVADGTYTGDGNRDLDFNGKAITVTSENGAEATIIDCQGRVEEPHRGFHFHSGETLSSVLDGFTITGGHISSTTPPNPPPAGAIYCDNSSPTIANNIILSNYAANFGAIYCNNNSSPLIISNNILDNSSSSGGGGICCRGGSSPTIVNNTISENQAGYGAGICVFSSSPIIIGNIISNNSVTQGTGHTGGGIAFIYFCSAVIQNNVISGNIADEGGGIVAYKSSGPIITNNTITGNTANLGGGISGEESSLTVLNSILWNDSPDEIYLDDSSTIDITYSDIHGGWPGAGNINADPLFVNAANADYHLQASSPCINAGDNSAIPQSVVVDPDGSPRIINGIVDMGAYEHETTWISVSGGQIDQRNLPPWTGGWTHVNPTRDDRATMWQTFTPSRPNLIAVDIDILTANPGHGDDTLTIEIAGDGEILGSTNSYVPDGFDGLLRCEFPDALPVIPGQLYELRVRDTGKTTFGWRYGGNTYDRGTRYVLSKESTNTDWFFRTYPAPSLSDSRIIYVDADATGANDGSSWADAYQCLQDALAAGQYGDEIRVAQGSYKPDQRVMTGRGGAQIRGSGDRTATFQLINGVSLKGGYAGIDEPDPDARDIEAYETILSGDLNGDDMPAANPSDLLYEPTRAENSYHVVTGSGTNATAVLDGFTITAGNANGPTTADKHGGGMYNQGGSPTLIRCIFHSNNSTASFGIGIGADGGGAIYNAGGRPALTQCTFTENNSARDGGGIFNINSRPTVTHCTFSGNSTDISGGGMYNYQSSPAVANCIFTGNSAQRGGGMRNTRNSKPTLTNCVFIGNWVETRRDPSSLVGGGAMANKNSSPTLTNCTFSENSADTRGGGMFNDSSSPTLTNCILWGDTPEEIYVSGGTPVITYSDVQGGWPGEGNIDAEPLFVDAANGDYHLHANSPCIDTGDNSAIPAGAIVDLDGNPRIMNGIVDMGAMEGGEEWPFAFNPEPADGAKYVNPNVELSWSSGSGAQLHIVYFGDNFDDMNTDAGGFLQETTTYTPGTLELDKVYYWRVDEFDGVVIHKGDVWSFSTAPDTLITDSNLVAYYPMNEGRGTIIRDAPGNGHDGKAKFSECGSF